MEIQMKMMRYHFTSTELTKIKELYDLLLAVFQKKVCLFLLSVKIETLHLFFKPPSKTKQTNKQKPILLKQAITVLVIHSTEIDSPIPKNTIHVQVHIFVK